MKKILLILSFFLAVSSWATIREYHNYLCSGKTESDCLANDGACGPLQWQSCGNGYVMPGYLHNCRFDRNCFCDIVTSSTACASTCELDSLRCVQSGKIWAYDGGATCGGMSCQAACDTTMQCIEYPFNHCEDVPSSGQIYCDENGCTGLPYSRWWSEYRKECHNECGQYETQSFTGDTLITMNSTCSDSSKCSDETFCVDFPSKNTYLLYTKCIVGLDQVGNGSHNQSYPQIVGGGTGSCASLGMPSNNIADPMNNSSPVTFPNTDNYDVIDDNCLIYGIGCPENFVDTTNYNDLDNRNSDHCVCERLDGMNHISTIICPDGSRTTFFGSCDDWRNARSSSSTNPPESSSSGSENPPTSSGGAGGGGNSSGISGEYPDWPEYSKNQRNQNDLLGSMTQTLKQIPVQLLQGMRDFFNGFVYKEGDAEFIYDRVDSLVTFDTIIDTAGILHAVFGRIDSNNHILDTLPHSSFTGCPCITFFRGNTQNIITNGHIGFKEIEWDLGNVHGFNLCRIFSAVVVAFASVVSFFIGFAIFKNISQ